MVSVLRPVQHVLVVPQEINQTFRRAQQGGPPPDLAALIRRRGAGLRYLAVGSPPGGNPRGRPGCGPGCNHR